MSTYVRVRKAERLHWSWAAFGAFALIATLAGKLYSMPSAVDLPAFPLTVALSAIPLLTLGLSGRLYRWSREGGQSRWMALFPAGVSAVWIALSVLFVATLSSGIPTETVWIGHGAIGSVLAIGTFGLSLNRIGTRRSVRPRFGKGPTPSEMESLLEAISVAAMEQAQENTALRSILERSRTAEWKMGSPAVEEVAGALLALQTVLQTGPQPHSRALDDSIKLVEKTLIRACK